MAISDVLRFAIERRLSARKADIRRDRLSITFDGRISAVRRTADIWSTIACEQSSHWSVRRLSLTVGSRVLGCVFLRRTAMLIPRAVRVCPVSDSALLRTITTMSILQRDTSGLENGRL